MANEKLLEGQVALNSILRRLPEIRLENDGDLEYHPKVRM